MKRKQDDVITRDYGAQIKEVEENVRLLNSDKAARVFSLRQAS